MSKFYTVRIDPIDTERRRRIHRPGKSFVMQFHQQINAECYMRDVAKVEDIKITPSFTPGFTPEELAAHTERRKRILFEAKRLQRQARIRSANNFISPNSFPCEVCGEKHENYNCCESCNYNNHRCHFCGDDLGHSEVSVCYITEEWND